jgi:hypothetical protein
VPDISLATSGLALATTALEMGPEMGLVLGGLIAMGVMQQFYQPVAQTIVLPDNLWRPWEYADKVRRLTLEKVYGTEKGDVVWNTEWNQRSTQIDLRSRAP